MDEYIYLDRHWWGGGQDGEDLYYVELYGPASATKPEAGIVAGFLIEFTADSKTNLYAFNPLGEAGSKWVAV